MRTALCVAFVVLLTACASVRQELNPDLFYKRDMSLEVNGVAGPGAVVAPLTRVVNIKGKAAGNLDLLTITTCHREYSAELSGNDFKYTFTAVEGLEFDRFCPIEIGGFEKKQGRHSWGYIDFVTTAETLPATLRCNGEEIKGKTVTTCQSRFGLLQEIIFGEPVDVRPDKGCELPMPDDRMTFVFPLAKKKCVYAFVTWANPKRIHRLVTLGYESILIRGN